MLEILFATMLMQHCAGGTNDSIFRSHEMKRRATQRVELNVAIRMEKPISLATLRS